MGYDTFLANETARYLDAQDKPQYENCFWCGSYEDTENMWQAGGQLFCSQGCIDECVEEEQI